MLLPFHLDISDVSNVGPPGEVDFASFFNPAHSDRSIIVYSASSHRDHLLTSSDGGYPSSAGSGNRLSSLSNHEVPLISLSGLTGPEGEVFTRDVPALLLGHSYDLLGRSNLSHVRLSCCDTLLTSGEHSSPGSGSLEHDLPPAHQLLMASNGCSPCLSPCNNGPSVGSASLG